MRTLMHEVLDIEAEAFPVPKEVYKTLDDVLRKAEASVMRDASPESILSSIGCLLKNEGFEGRESLELADALSQKRIDCKHFSLLYHSIGEQLGLPLHIVLCPSHALVKWDDRASKLNWETTMNFEANDRYIDSLGIHSDAVRNGVYLRNITRNQALGQFGFCLRGLKKAGVGNVDGALADLNHAISLDPCNPCLYNNRGAIEGDTRNHIDAMRDFDKALSLDQNMYGSHLGCGYLLLRSGDFQSAMRYFDRAIGIRPNAPESYQLRAEAMSALDRPKEAKKDMDMYSKLMSVDQSGISQ